MKRLLLFVILAVHACATIAQGSLEVIPLKYRSAEQVIPVLRPLMEPGSALSGQGYQLFVRASPRNLADLKRMLAAIDTPQRRLLISVRMDNSADTANSGIDARGTVRSGAVTLGTQRSAASGQSGVDARVLSSRSATDERVDQRVQVLEGARAFISTGQSRALPQTQIMSGPGGTYVQENTVIQNLDTGFEVVPRISGSTVVLDISPHRQVPGTAGTGSVESQQVSTSVSAQLGEWVELGGSFDSASRNGSGVLSTREARASASRRVWVKVEEMRP